MGRRLDRDRSGPGPRCSVGAGRSGIGEEEFPRRRLKLARRHTDFTLAILVCLSRPVWHERAGWVSTAGPLDMRPAGLQSSRFWQLTKQEARQPLFRGPSGSCMQGPDCPATDILPSLPSRWFDALVKLPNGRVSRYRRAKTGG